MTIARRTVLAGGLAAPFILGAGRARAATTVRMGTLKLIHAITPYFYQRFVPEGVAIEIIPFESPPDGKDAVVSGTVDFGTFGIAAATLGAAVHQPVVVIGSSCNKGMAIVARKDSPINSIAGLKGKRVAIWPRHDAGGVPAGAAAHGRDVGARHHPGPGVVQRDARGAGPRRCRRLCRRRARTGLSLATGIGKIVEYPYSTAMGSLNMILATSRDMVTQKPDLCRTMVKLQRQASEYAMSHRDEMVAMTVAKLGSPRRRWRSPRRTWS